MSFLKLQYKKSLAIRLLIGCLLWNNVIWAQDNVNRAEKLFFEKKYYAALHYLQILLSKSPEDYRAHRLAGDANAAIGKYNEAQEHYQRAAEFSSDSAKDWLAIGQVLYLQENGDLALKYLKKAQSKLPLALFYQGLCYYKLYGDVDQTIRYWEEYVATQPEDEKIVREAIEILKRKGTLIPPYNNDKQNTISPNQQNQTNPKPLLDKHVSPEKLLSPK